MSYVFYALAAICTAIGFYFDKIANSEDNQSITPPSTTYNTNGIGRDQNVYNGPVTIQHDSVKKKKLSPDAPKSLNDSHNTGLEISGIALDNVSNANIDNTEIDGIKTGVPTKINGVKATDTDSLTVKNTRIKNVEGTSGQQVQKKKK